MPSKIADKLSKLSNTISDRINAATTEDDALSVAIAGAKEEEAAFKEFSQDRNEDTSSSQNDDYGFGFGPPCETPLKPGAVIKYHDPMSVAGTPGSLRRAVVKEVVEVPDPDSLETSYPLKLYPICPLRDGHQIMVESLPNDKGELERVSKPKWYPISKHNLIVGSISSNDRDLAGGATLVAIMRKRMEVVQAQHQEMADFLVKPKANSSANDSGANASTVARGAAATGDTFCDKGDDGFSPSEYESQEDNGLGDEDSECPGCPRKVTGKPMGNNKCTVCSCPGLTEPLGLCDAPNCDRCVHKQCYESLLAKHKLPTIRGGLACTKGCYGKIARKHNPASLGWNNDGKLGPNDANTSEKILIELMQETDFKGNSIYSNMRQGNITPTGSGRTKQHWGKFLAKRINNEGVLVERTGKDVLNKISWIETNMRECYRWSSETGQGIKDNEGDVSYEEALKNKFSYFPVLDPFFRDRAGMNPTMTSDDLETILSEEQEAAPFTSPAAPFTLPAARPASTSATGSTASRKGTMAHHSKLGNEYYDENYYWCCGCGKAAAACGACGNGYGRKQAIAIKHGLGEVDDLHVFRYTGPKHDEFSPEEKVGVKRKSPTKKAKTASTSSPRKRLGRGSSSFNSYIALKTDMMRANQTNKMKSDDALLDEVDADLRTKVALARKFKEMTDSLSGDRVTAAKICPAFKVFLKPSEMEELED